MKNILKIAAVLGLLTMAAVAAIDPYTDYATSGTRIGGTTNSYVIITTHSFNGAAPRIQYINAGSDKTGSKIQFYTSGQPDLVTATNSTTTLFVANTNGIGTVNMFIVIQHLNNDTYELGRIASFTGQTNIVLFNAPSTTAVPGDILYGQTSSGSILTSTNNANGATPLQKIDMSGPGIYTGLQKKPLLMILDTTSAGDINAVNATFR